MRYPIIIAVWAVCCVLPLGNVAEAQGAPDTAAAAAAFEAGTQAQLRGDYSEAARFFELADRAAPSPQALRSAIRMRREAGQNARAATLALAAMRRYTADATTRALAEETLAELQPGLMALRVTCSEPCTVLIDGVVESNAVNRTWDIFVQPGTRSIAASFSAGTTEATSVDAVAGQRATLEFDAPAAPVAPEEPEPTTAPVEPPPLLREPSTGPPPALFWTGVGLSVALTATTIVMTVDTMQAVDDYEAMPTRARYDAGQGKQRRMYTFAALSGVFIVGTVVLGVLTDFGGEDDLDAADRRVRPSLFAGRDGGGLSLSGSF